MELRLETNRLYLLPFNEKDALKVRDLANNKEIAEILGLPYPYELKFAQEWIASQPELIKRCEEFPLKIVSKQLMEIVGTITIRVDKDNNKGELGYWIGKDYWGKGYATESINRIVDYGFSELKLNKIWAAVISRNIASIKVLMKVGLQKEGTLRQNKLILHSYEDVDIFGILKNEYNK